MDDRISYKCKLHLVTSVYLTLASCSSRYAHGYICAVYILLIVLLLLVNFQIYTWQSNTLADQIDRPLHCNQSMIAKHFMHNQSPQQLFAQNSSRILFTYELHNDDICVPRAPHALLFVISKSAHFAWRDAIRRTWADFSPITSTTKYAHLRLKLLFLLDVDETLLLSVKLEQSLYHDLVQVRLPQHYILSTYRDMAILHWTETYCSTAPITIKTDDDVFLNTFLLANVLTHILQHTTIHQGKADCQAIGNLNSCAVIYGFEFKNAHAIHDARELPTESARYVVTNDEYPCTYYPDYMSGFGYMVNRNARIKLLCAFANRGMAFPLSDVYVTGILPEYLNIHRQHLRLKISYRAADDCDRFFNDNNAYACASSLHYAKKESSSFADVDIFDRFNTLWNRVCHNRWLYINQNRIY